MTVKVLFLKTGQYLISEIDERREDTDCILINPKHSWVCTRVETNFIL